MSGGLNTNEVLLSRSQAKFRKNAIFTDQSSFSNFALCVIIEKNSTQVAGMTATQWTMAEKITNLAVAALSEPLGKAREEAKKVQDDDIKFKAHAELKKPGEKYTFSGTLSLTMTVYVMNEELQLDKRACFTGPTHDSENIYPISQYFTNLDVI